MGLSSHFVGMQELLPIGKGDSCGTFCFFAQDLLFGILIPGYLGTWLSWNFCALSFWNFCSAGKMSIGTKELFISLTPISHYSFRTSQYHRISPSW